MGTNTSPRVAWKTGVFLSIAVLGNSFGNLTLAIGMDRMPAFNFFSLGHYFLCLITNPYVLVGCLLTAIYTLAQLSLFSWADLSYVIPCTASTYIISTMLGQFVIGEQVHLQRWLGVLLIFAGVMLVANTPMATKQRGKQEPAC